MWHQIIKVPIALVFFLRFQATWMTISPYQSHQTKATKKPLFHAGKAMINHPSMVKTPSTEMALLWGWWILWLLSALTNNFSSSRPVGGPQKPHKLIQFPSVWPAFDSSTLSGEMFVGFDSPREDEFEVSFINLRKACVFALETNLGNYICGGLQFW
jgi:hypothetical protein